MGKREVFVAIASCAIGFGGAAMIELGPELYPQYKNMMWIGGCLLVAIGFAGLFWALFWPRPKEANPMTSGGDDKSIKIGSISGSSIGHIGHNFGSVERRLTQEQGDKILRTISGMPGEVSLKVIATIGDGAAYMGDFYAVFEAAGWEISNGTLHGGRPFAGVALYPHSEIGYAAAEAIRAAGIDCAVQPVTPSPFPFGRDLEIMIGMPLR